MKKKTELKSGRQTRHLATISEFTTDIQHIDGKDNVVADTLSRIPPQLVTLVDPSDIKQEGTIPAFMFNTVNTIWPGLYHQAMSLVQQSDSDVQTYRTAITSLRLEDVPFLMVLSPYCAMFYWYAETSCTRELVKIGF